MQDIIIYTLISAFTIVFLIIVNNLNFSKRIKLIFCFVILLEGLSLLIFYPWFPYPVSLSFIIFSSIYIFSYNKEKWFAKSVPLPVIKSNIILKYLLPYNLYIGVSMMVGVFAIEYFLGDGRLSLPTQLIFIAGMVLAIYNYVSERFNFERDFILFFFLSFSLFYSLPFFLYKFISNSETDFSLATTDFLLVRPLENLLNLLGLTVWSTETELFFEDLNSGTVNSVLVAVECSGIYSMMIFLSAFVSYILVTHNLFDRDVFFLLVCGIIITYLANIFRMAIIVIIGHYYGIEALKWVHLNVGWVIFLIWIFIFWNILDRFISYKEIPRSSDL